MIVTSFGYKHGEPAPRDHQVVINCRGLRNPHSTRHLRDLDGRNPQVMRFVQVDPAYATLMAQAAAAAKTGKDVAFGCYGGRHRSVVMAEALAARLRAVGVCVTVQHLQLVDH